ncbi:prepilin-type N-terminal cleavage/methylation domain-containing protein [Acetomicrobium mobile DSM 13181]|uniref:Prepilin-type N-terminal cleavage/methylation domain-containing protein n=1 Tax=Acetomicrobium mobile (strain ATCC BAA-54 / DSM 13181 / JCM 12221 / NGA) TaxID=891968 RepID=I4BZ85_ACEMN|nr:prepilin-type N-terminal cleavage/methylation domain-containing protein [Acetomicrobium mobile]AFM22592.1 prepilin-type N-terminal cleavage/methylation domain-containing protein [Acetomicrobium mobile DSM 13181]
MISEMKKGLQRKGARRGFTLVELLIVIIIIGILAGAMMLVAGTSRDAAEASKIISDLRSVKAAAVMWLTENPNVTRASWDGEGTPVPNVDLTTPLSDDPTPLNKYLDKPLIPEKHNFLFEAADIKVGEDDTETEGDESKATVWFLGYNLGENGANVREGVKTNLAKQAKSVGLYGEPLTSIDLTSDTPGYYTGGNKVYIIVQ